MPIAKRYPELAEANLARVPDLSFSHLAQAGELLKEMKEMGQQEGHGR
jgi:hypothetical protein